MLMRENGLYFYFIYLSAGAFVFKQIYDNLYVKTNGKSPLIFLFAADFIEWNWFYYIFNYLQEFTGKAILA